MDVEEAKELSPKESISQNVAISNGNDKGAFIQGDSKEGTVGFE